MRNEVDRSISSSFWGQFELFAGLTLFLAACTVSAQPQGQESAPVAEDPVIIEEAYVLVPDARPDLNQLGPAQELKTVYDVEQPGSEDGFIVKKVLVVHVADAKRWKMDDGAVVLVHMLPGGDDPILYQWLIEGEEENLVFSAFNDGPIYVNRDIKFKVISMEFRQFRITIDTEDEQGQPTTVSRDFTVLAASAKEPAEAGD